MNRKVTSKDKTYVIINLIIITVLIAAPLHAQDNPATASEPITLDGRKALQFGIGSNLTLTSVENAVISYKWMTGQTRGYRLNLRLAADYQDRSQDRTNLQEFNWTLEEQYRTTLVINVGATFEFLRYHEVHNRLFMYTLIGPTIDFRYYDWVINDLAYNNTNGDSELLMDRERKRNETRIGGGATAGIGLEWFVNPYLSLSGEYALSLLASYLMIEEKNSGFPAMSWETFSNEILEFSLQGSGARIRLSVYF
ncbi:hypothetical protein CYPRO_2901 [Cyclonatronum proteinivorum]|uniref:Outer membrane protein beta-barrel domain-containing protein n=1 Tax=Cyclonatronum proteinivorum TaxID=1457365 RepID=A0A345UNT7_9BACT|nr:hypothetical protein [Cyclonatronum proteinivorum]AXJ02139.1 hypothetical protein CYPRO_2901 [Cyclonatronum proteinivorum]